NATPVETASSTERRIVPGSPACQPHAMLTELTCGSTAESLPSVQRPKLSPASALRSIRVFMAWPFLSGRGGTGQQTTLRTGNGQGRRTADDTRTGSNGQSVARHFEMIAKLSLCGWHACRAEYVITDTLEAW